jgi:SAM-dependent methyltransferase
MSKYHYSFFSEYCKPGMNILDIGCGAGTLMSWAVLGGLNAYGVNPDPGFAKFGLVHYGLKEVQICLFEEACFSPAIFDIITLNHVFEHFSDAVASIEKIRSYLKENGLLYLSIPNLLTPHGQIEYNFFLEHVNTFSVKTISLLLKKMGFKIIKLSTFGYVTETSLHHPYIDLVARKMNVSIPQAIDWQSEREDYLFIKGFLRDYQRGFFKKNGRLRVFWGDLKQLVTSYVKNKSWFISISANYPKFLKHLINNYVHTEPDHCVAPKVTVFPPEECIYYE